MKTRSTERANQRNRFWLMASASVLIFACAPLFAPLAPTLDPNSFNTAIAETAAAAQTQTALLTPPTWTPSFTPFPTGTASITPTATETFVFALATFTQTKTPSPIPSATSEGGNGGGGGGNLACTVTGVSPSNGTVFSPNANFDAVWTVKNTGSSRWTSSEIDYVYVSGRAMHKQNGYDLPASVNTGKSIDLAVDMKAPGSSGTYSTTWRMKFGQTYFCEMKLTIVVQ